MTPAEYEQVVANYFYELGYSIEMTTSTNDYGIDIFAVKGNTKIAIQVKMYGDTNRDINRKAVMELHGAKDYFDCKKAVIATNGDLMNDAFEVAEKLSIEILKIPAVFSKINKVEINEDRKKFDDFWEEQILPLKGKTLKRANGKTNIIVEVNSAGIERLTSNNRPQRIDIEIFRQVILHLFKYGSITRKEINQEYLGRASSGIVLILSNTPVFEKTFNPAGLKVTKNNRN